MEFWSREILVRKEFEGTLVSKILFQKNFSPKGIIILSWTFYSEKGCLYGWGSKNAREIQDSPRKEQKNTKLWYITWKFDTFYLARVP